MGENQAIHRTKLQQHELLIEELAEENKRLKQELANISKLLSESLNAILYKPQPLTTVTEENAPINSCQMSKSLSRQKNFSQTTPTKDTQIRSQSKGSTSIQKNPATKMINNTPNTTTKENTIYIISKTDISSDDTMEIMGKIRDSAMTQIPKVPRTKPNVMIVTTHAHEYEETLNSLYKYGISTGTFIASPSTMPQGETFSKIECKSPNKAYIQEKIGMLIQILKSQKVKNIYTNLYVSNDTFTLIVGHTDSNVITTIVNKSKGVFVEIPKPFITRSSEEFHKSGICCFPEQTSPNDIKEAIKKSLEISQVDFDENKLNITKLKSNYSSGGYYYKAIYICNDQEDLKKLCNQLITMKTNTTPSAASYLIIKRFKPLAEQNNSSTPIKHSQGNNQELGSAKYVENKLEQHDQKLHDMKTSMESIQKDMIEVKQILSKLPELIQQTVSLYVSKENDKRKSTNLSPRDGAGKKAKRTVEVDMFDDEF